MELDPLLLDLGNWKWNHHNSISNIVWHWNQHFFWGVGNPKTGTLGSQTEVVKSSQQFIEIPRKLVLVLQFSVEPFSFNPPVNSEIPVAPPTSNPDIWLL